MIARSRSTGRLGNAGGWLLREAYMQTPEMPLQVRPALSHSLFVVYDRGEAPGYDVAYDSWLAHPAMNPITANATASVFMGLPPVRGRQQPSRR
jgi:hypothetical protein